MLYQYSTTLSYPECWFAPQAVYFDGLSLGTMWKGVRLWAILLRSLTAVMLRESTWEWHLEMLVRKCVRLFTCLFNSEVDLSTFLHWRCDYFSPPHAPTPLSHPIGALKILSLSYPSRFVPQIVCVCGGGAITHLKLPGRCMSWGFVVVPLLLLLIDFTSRGRQAYQPNASLSNDWDPISA